MTSSQAPPLLLLLLVLSTTCFLFAESGKMAASAPRVAVVEEEGESSSFESGDAAAAGRAAAEAGREAAAAGLEAAKAGHAAAEAAKLAKQAKLSDDNGSSDSQAAGVFQPNRPVSPSDRRDDVLARSVAGQLFDEFWTWRIKQSPEFGAMIGSKENSQDLEVFTETRFEENFNTCNLFIDRAALLLNSTTEDEGLRLNLQFFIAEVKTFVDGYPFKGFHFPMNYMEGVQVDFQRIGGEWLTLTTLEDYQDLIARYNKFRSLADEIIGMQRGAIEQKRTNHNVSMATVESQLRQHTSVSPEETEFYIPFKSSINVTQEQLEQLRADAISAIRSSIQPGMDALADFIKTEYIPNTRTEIAASSISPEFYASCLAFHTSTNLTAQEIHDQGLQEVERIEEEMREIVKEMGYNNLTLAEFIEMLRNDKNNFFDSPEELMAKFHEIIEQKIDPKLLEFFHEKPATELEIVETPASTPDAPAAFYIAGSVDGSRPGRLFINTHKYESQPRYEMVSLSLHESNPGHHLQGSYSLAQTDWPMFRKVMEDKSYSLAPSRFPINTAFNEGWALYTETLGFDMGLYTDPLDRYGHLSEEIFRACRLVVDTGMHALGWSIEQAVEYMTAHTAASIENIRGEVNRYVTWPGQATGYKIGQIKIRELRTRAETQLGGKFKIKDFHQVVLNSAGPLNILEEQVDKFIQDNK